MTVVAEKNDQFPIQLKAGNLRGKTTVKTQILPLYRNKDEKSSRSLGP